MQERLQQQLAFIVEIDKLKQIVRKSKLFHADRRENDAEHSWHLAMMALVLSEYANEKINVLKVIQMVLIHDIVEIDTDDTFLYDAVKSHANTEEELKAAHRIFGLLPDEQAKEFIDIWHEFELGESSEAKFARAIDRLEPVMQNVYHQGGVWKEHDISQEKVLAKNQIMEKGSNTLWNYTKSILDEGVEKGFLKRN